MLRRVSPSLSTLLQPNHPTRVEGGEAETILALISPSVNYTSVQATQWPGLTSRNSGTALLQLSTASGHLG